MARHKTPDWLRDGQASLKKRVNAERNAARLFTRRIADERRAARALGRMTDALKQMEDAKRRREKHLLRLSERRRQKGSPMKFCQLCDTPGSPASGKGTCKACLKRQKHRIAVMAEREKRWVIKARLLRLAIQREKAKTVTGEVMEGWGVDLKLAYYEDLHPRNVVYNNQGSL